LEEEANKNPDVEKPEFFDISSYGVPVAIFGMLYMFIFSRFLLPGDKDKAVKCEYSPLVDLLSRIGYR